jgi:hypothetical protein
MLPMLPQLPQTALRCQNKTICPAHWQCFVISIALMTYHRPGNRRCQHPGGQADIVLDLYCNIR